jgi:type I restriction enzyme S subunit
MTLLPAGWHFSQVGATGEVMSGRQRSPHLTSGTMTPYLRVANVLDGRIDFGDVNAMPFTSSEVEKYRLVPGDILLNEGQSINLVGRAAMFGDKEKTHCFQNTLIRYRAGDRVDPDYALQLFRFSQAQGIFSQIAVRTNSIAHLGVSRFSELELRFPPLAEQRKIAEILRTWDDAIDKTMELRRLAHALRTDLAERMLVPSHGVRRKLSELTSPIKTRNSAAVLGRESVMGVSNRTGLVPMREQTIAADISRYQVLPPRAFAYNPMRINVGSIAMSQSESDVLVSPDYVLFKCDERELRPEYLDHVLRTRWWLHHVNAGASGSVRTRTYYDDLAAISIAAPPVAEQDNVSRAFDGLGRESELLQRKAELLRTQKRGLMQKLLTGQVRVSVAADVDPGGPEND